MKRTTLTNKATRSLRRAVRKVVAERRMSGDPIAVWKDGKAVWVQVKKASRAKGSNSAA